jgi:D-alanyl-lipoteichoic acid acyltransferase DltB (MBOAT superfamily)
MLFNSLSFLVFFPLVTALYFLTPHRWRTSLLLAASCAFYMAFVPAYILILVFTIIIDYAAGIWIEQSEGRRRKAALVVSIVANVGVLAVFKYYGFLTGNIRSVAHLLGTDASLPILRIVLPIGLSFHTFQAMSYTIEVYFGRFPAERNFLRYALYVMFYPQLVAGPIERPQNLLHQFREEHHFDYERVAAGLLRMAVGMFKKVVIADTLALYVNDVYTKPQAHHGLPLILATLFFAFQIYWDFSGYSDIALGSAQVMGFSLMENFRTPYAAASISEFWRRWHISLSTWFRDYVYIPMGGNRVSRAARYRNLMIVFLLSGLWHGANWTFVIWGGLHGFFLVCGEITRPMRQRLLARFGASETTPLVRAWSVAMTFVLVTFAWVFFRAASFNDAFYVLTHFHVGLLADIRAVASRTALDQLLSPVTIGIRIVAIAAMLAFESLAHRKPEGEAGIILGMPVRLRYAVYYLLIYVTLLRGGGGHPQFIYFQF